MDNGIVKTDILNPVLSNKNLLAVNKVSEKSFALRRVKTPPEKIRTRKGKDGQTWKYIKRIDAMEWLDKHYPAWSFEVIPDGFKEYGGHVYATGKLTVIETGDFTFKRTIVCVGSDEIEFRKNDKSIPVAMTYYKNAETDALKRCVFTLGGFCDVYTDEKFTAINENVIPDSELDWFLVRVLPLLMRRYQTKEILARNIFKSLRGYMAGTISKETLSKAFPELNG